MPSGRQTSLGNGAWPRLRLAMELHVARRRRQGAAARGHKRRKVNKYCSTKCDDQDEDTNGDGDEDEDGVAVEDAGNLKGNGATHSQPPCHARHSLAKILTRIKESLKLNALKMN